MGDSLEANVKNIDRFEVRKILGEGGQGIVYLAHDPKLKREVAIKTLTAATGDEMEILLHEARAVGALQHPCIVPVFEAGDFYGTPYLVFEYVTGETLDALIKRSGAIPTDDALRIAAQVLDGLAHAHKHGVLHRDIKPANIMLGSDGTPRIMDFGAASRNHVSWLDGAHVGIDEDLIGTPAYMAPEYIEKKVYSARTDIFAAGLVFCEMLTGERVFKANGGSVDQLLLKIVNDPIVLPTGPGLNEKIVACLLKAMDKDPEERYESVVEMKEALLQAFDPESHKAAAIEGRGTVEFLLRRIKLKKEFPAMSESISNVNNIIFSDTGSVTTLTNAVLKDFALTNKIIKLANSTYYNQSGRGNISTISGAVYRLGFDTIRNIVLGLLLFDHLKDRNQAQDLMGECVRAILGGAIAKEICVSQGYANPEETFVCAMMHNLGRMLSIYYFPEETREIRKLLELGASDEEQTSKRVLGASYTELGQGVAKSWGFPQKIIGSMEKNRPQNAPRGRHNPDETTRLIACLASDLSATVVEGDPEEQKKRSAETLEKYRDRLKLNPKEAEGMFARSLEKFKEYTVAVGWKLDQSIANRLGMLENPSEETADVEITQVMQAGNLQTQDIEKTMRVEFHTTALVPPAPAVLSAPPTPQPEQARVRKDVLSGGIQDITNAMVEGSSLNDILRIIIETIYTGIGFDHVIFALRTPRRATMTGRFGLGENIDSMVGQFQFSLDFVPDVFHVALQKNIDVFITDTGDPKIVTRIPDWYRKTFSAGAFLLFPIILKDKPFGMIYGDSARPNSITIHEDEIKLLRTLRNQAVLAVRQSG
ncbi:MAG: HDOD domain-containing protein [Burkholderiales bacterium]|nr:HDOD domain-containing protein [Burkholderiales bacterium]